jgi:hypothetical protein
MTELSTGLILLVIQFHCTQPKEKIPLKEATTFRVEYKVFVKGKSEVLHLRLHEETVQLIPHLKTEIREKLRMAKFTTCYKPHGTVNSHTAK